MAAHFGMHNQEIVRAWLAYNLHQSAGEASLVVLMSAVGQGIGAPLGGVAADRFDRRRITMSMQAVMFAAAALVGVLVILNVIELWHLLMLALVTGGAGSLHAPARQSLVFNLVGPKHVSNALAINSGVASVTTLVGPAIAGLVIATVGVGPAYFCSVAAFAISIATLRGIVEGAPRRIADERESLFRSMTGGARYLFRQKPLFWLFIISCGGIMIGHPFRNNMSPFAVEALNGGPGTFGVLLSLIGLGAVGAGIFIAAISDYKNKGNLLIWSGVAWGLAIVALSQAPNLLVAVPILLVIGVSQMFFQVMTNIGLQTNVEDAYRGRILSFHVMSFSLSGITALLLGYATDWAGVRPAFLGLGLILFAFVAVMGFWRKDVRTME